MSKTACTRSGRKIQQPARFRQPSEQGTTMWCDSPKPKRICHSPVPFVNDETEHTVSAISPNPVGAVDMTDVADFVYTVPNDTCVDDPTPTRCTSATSMTEEARILVADGFLRRLSDTSDTPPGRTGSATSVDSGPIRALSVSDML